MSQLTLSLGEAVVICTATLTILLFLFATFTRKDEFKSGMNSLGKRIGALEEKVMKQDEVLSEIRSGISYIKGRLEPKGE